VAHLHYPRAHWPRIRHTNLIERTFGETRRRVKVIGRLPGERSALSLLFAVLDRAAGGCQQPRILQPLDVLAQRDRGGAETQPHPQASAL
jgi:transposase-like protein